MADTPTEREANVTSEALLAHDIQHVRSLNDWTDATSESLAQSKARRARQHRRALIKQALACLIVIALVAAVTILLLTH